MVPPRSGLHGAAFLSSFPAEVSVAQKPLCHSASKSVLGASLLCAWPQARHVAVGRAEREAMTRYKGAGCHARCFISSVCKGNVRTGGPWSLPDERHCLEREGAQAGLRNACSFPALYWTLEKSLNLGAVDIWGGSVLCPRVGAEVGQGLVLFILG